MNLSLNKKRFESHIIYDWVKYIAVCLAIIIAFSVFYGATAKQLTDVEELRVVLYCGNYSESKLASLADLAQDEISTAVNPELKDVFFNSYSTMLVDVDDVKLDVEIEEQMGDIFILPSVTEYRKKIENSSGMAEEYQWQFTENYLRSHQALSGRYMFYAIDEMIEAEKSCGDELRAQRAEELENILSKYDEDELYCTYARAYVRTAADPYVPNDVDEQGNAIEKKWGINLSVLDQTKLNQYFVAEEDMELVLGVRDNSENLSDSVAFVTWLFENFERQ